MTLTQCPLEKPFIATHPSLPHSSLHQQSPPFPFLLTPLLPAFPSPPLFFPPFSSLPLPSPSFHSSYLAHRHFCNSQDPSCFLLFSCYFVAYLIVFRLDLSYHNLYHLRFTLLHSSSLLFSSHLFSTVLFCSVLFCSPLFCSLPSSPLFTSLLFSSVLFCSVLLCSVLFFHLHSSVRFCSSFISSLLFSFEYFDMTFHFPHRSEVSLMQPRGSLRPKKTF